jgi:hypothetical protein
MLEMYLLRSVMWTLATVFGSLGVFFVVLSFSAPALCGLAMVLIGAALGITYCLNDR